ncbi:MAG: hypothetical protein Q4D80_00515 [Pseudomonadota bacterium]|nr:hypothetical protein [Pseudomonadota bacterium]
MEKNVYSNFMAVVKQSTPEERNKVAASFRKDLKAYKIGGAVMKIVDSKSEKVPLYINVMCQQYRKAQFAEEFDAECRRLCSVHWQNPEMVQRIRALHEVVSTSKK